MAAATEARRQLAAVQCTAAAKAHFESACQLFDQDHGRLGDKNANADVEVYDATRAVTADLIRNFNATTECEKVTCLYNDVNWWIERLIENPEQLDKLQTDSESEPDYFL